MFAKFLHPDDSKATVTAWRAATTAGEPFTFEHRFRRADGTYRWHLTNARPMRDAEGAISMWIGSSTDIEDVKQAQKREAMLEHKAASLQHQRQQLLELHKAKDEFISLASHQLRTPATGVKQYLGMILEGIIDTSAAPPEILKMIEVAYESNERQLKIVNDLLKVAYVDAGRVKLIKSDCNVDELIHGAMEELADVFASRRQKITYTNTATGITVPADCRLLRMVVENLIDNASKYSPQGKSVSISVQRAAGFLCINVTDHGVGISRADQIRLFKKFSRIENPLSTQVGGTGLGLYWAQQVISLHRGSIMVRSTPGKGSTFSVQLPLG
jgi:signal transduction histidine kinase